MCAVSPYPDATTADITSRRAIIGPVRRIIGRGSVFMDAVCARARLEQTPSRGSQ
jgi:hypothetical protein